MTKQPIDTIATLTICYQSGTGKFTQRGVSVTGYDDYQMVGMCHLRNSERTFVYERITSCVNRDTGEIVTDIYEHLKKAYIKSPLHSADLLYRNHHEAMQVLIYVARADGQFRAEERKVITAACKVITGDTRITDELARHLSDSINPPSLHAFKVAVGRIAKRGNETTMKRLYLACRTIVNTQKNVTATEQEALDYMLKRFKLPES